MKTLIYSDVHGNLPAFERMLEVENTCEGYICLGDLVNYGPWSNECVDLACSLPNSVLLMGNHEEAFIDGEYPGNNEIVKQFFNKTFKTFKRYSLIKTFKDESKIGKYICRHTILDQYIYPDTSITLNDNYIIGHSHHQFEYKNNAYTLYNAGSVGQNRKYINVVNYLIFDSDTQLIQMKYLTYNVDLILNEMKKQQYTEICLNYYLQKEIYKYE